MAKRKARKAKSKKRNLKCKYCGKENATVKEVPNPYDDDVCGRTVIEPLCDDCYNELADEI